MGESGGMRNRLRSGWQRQRPKPLRRQGKAGAPGEVRTPNPQIRSLVLYPVELRALTQGGETWRAEDTASYEAIQRLRQSPPDFPTTIAHGIARGVANPSPSPRQPRQSS